MFDAQNGAAQVYAVAQPRGECIRHELIAALEAEQLLRLEIGAPKLFYRCAPYGLQSAARAPEKLQRGGGRSLALQQLPDADLIERTQAWLKRIGFVADHVDVSLQVKKRQFRPGMLRQKIRFPLIEPEFS